MSSVIPPKSQPLQSHTQSDLRKLRYREIPLSWVAQGVSSRSRLGSQASWLGLLWTPMHLTTQVMLHASPPPNPSRKRRLAQGFQQTDSSTGLLCSPESSYPEPQILLSKREVQKLSSYACVRIIRAQKYNLLRIEQRSQFSHL